MHSEVSVIFRMNRKWNNVHRHWLKWPNPQALYHNMSPNTATAHVINNGSATPQHIRVATTAADSTHAHRDTINSAYCISAALYNFLRYHEHWPNLLSSLGIWFHLISQLHWCLNFPPIDMNFRWEISYGTAATISCYSVEIAQILIKSLQKWRHLPQVWRQL